MKQKQKKRTSKSVPGSRSKLNLAECSSPYTDVVGYFKILKETSEEWVKFDVEMSDYLVNYLLDYAELNMSFQERKEIFINWAFTDILKKLAKRRKK